MTTDRKIHKANTVEIRRYGIYYLCKNQGVQLASKAALHVLGFCGAPVNYQTPKYMRVGFGNEMPHNPNADFQMLILFRAAEMDCKNFISLRRY